MNEYHFELAGLHAVLRTQEKLRVAGRLRPFLSEISRPVDLAVTIRSLAVLPESSPNAVKSAAESYDRVGDVLRIFHFDTPESPAFAVTQLEAGGKADIFVLPGYEDRFSGTTGILNRIGMENFLLSKDAILLHAAFVACGGKGVLFTGPSGVGKSTQADLWEKHLGAEIINGDRAVLRKEAGWTAYGSPYAGSSGIYRNENAPVSAIVVLKQAKENRLEKLTSRQAFPEVYSQLALCRWDRVFMEKATDLCLDLLQNVPVYRLSCLPAESAVDCLRKGLGL